MHAWAMRYQNAINARPTLRRAVARLVTLYLLPHDSLIRQHVVQHSPGSPSPRRRRSGEPCL